MGDEKKTKRVSIATVQSLADRLSVCAERTKLAPSVLAEAALAAIVQAIEKHAYRVVFPVEFETAYVPAQAREGATLILQEPPLDGSASDAKADHTKTRKRAQPQSARE